VIDSLESIAQASDADYVIVSQAKLNDRYVPALAQLNAEMLIIDEQHKLKNADGVWSQALYDLARESVSPDNFLVLLSGTPVPNKVADIASALKLLYLHHPEISQMSAIELKRQIIAGDLQSLGSVRKLLIPYMQAKTLEHSEIELQPLQTEVMMTELTTKQASIYESLLDEDEMSAMEKMDTLWKFLHNPAMLDIRPDLGSPKETLLQNQISQMLAAGKRKIVIFVNRRIQDVIRGDSERTILSRL
jgi:SNF2 family DNA or RNA helicase